MTCSILTTDHHKIHIRIYIVFMIITICLISYDASSQVYGHRKIRQSLENKQTYHSLINLQPIKIITKLHVDTFHLPKNKTTHYKVGDMRKSNHEK